MFRIESYVTPILLSYVDKYVRDFKPKDAQVSLWGGGVALHNLVIKVEVLQQELSLPFTLISGRIHELLIQVPWTKIMSEPIVVTIDTIECILGLNPPPDQTPQEETSDTSVNSQVVEAPPGYMQALVRKIVSNISLNVHHLIVKLVQDDIVLSLNIKHLSVSSAGTNWEAAFADIDPNAPVIRRLVRLDDLTLCLDRSDADGKIRYYLEPLLYRCQLDFRVLTRLVSVNVRRASSIALEIRSTRLAWAICNEQLLLLLRLSQDIAARKLSETPPKAADQPVPKPRDPAPTTTSTLDGEPAVPGSWSEWAWSWLPAWEPDESSTSPVVAGPEGLPISVSVRLDEIVLMYKVLESDSSAARRRARSILELHLNYLITRMNLVAPTCLNIRFGLRDLTLLSFGRCVCSHLNKNSAVDEPTKYLFRGVDPLDASWTWPDDDIMEEICVPPPKAQSRLEQLMAESVITFKPFSTLRQSRPSLSRGSSKSSTASLQSQNPDDEKSDKTQKQDQPKDQPKDQPINPSAQFWKQVDPLIFIEIGHFKSPPISDINPYDNPPADFEYSDWAEDSSIKMVVKSLNFHLRTGLLHRLQTVQELLSRLEPVSTPVKPRRTLTVEENESLLNNLPQRQIVVQLNDFFITLFPWDHSITEKQQPKQMFLEIHIPLLTVQMTSPLYPHRVCSAASQLPVCGGPLLQASRLQTTVNLESMKLYLRSENGTKKYVATASLKLVSKQLLNKDFFQINTQEIVHTSLNLKIFELNVCSCAARLFAVVYLLQSITKQQQRTILWNSSVCKDAICDEKQVALDFTIEELTLRLYQTKNIITSMSTVKSVKATLIREQDNDTTHQAWLFSGPDAPSHSPYFRMAFQCCTSPTPVTLEYFGFWTEPTVICIDPMLAMFLNYRPMQRITPETNQSSSSLGLNAKRRYTPPSSNGRGTSGSGPELVHTRTRSSDSSPTPTEKQPSIEKIQQPRKKNTQWYRGKQLLDLHKRLQRATFLIEIGMTMVYVTVSTATAVNTVTIRDAMEIHATTCNLVTAFGLGILTMGSNSESQALWQDIRNDGPTFFTETINAFPWRLSLSDITCYTLDAQPKVDSLGRDKSAHGLRSKLKVPLIVTPNNIIDLVSTTVIISVVTKKAKIAKSNAKSGKDEEKKGTGKKHGKANEDDEGNELIQKQIDYFSSGIDFSPSTLKEFLRGPIHRKRKMLAEELQEPVSTITFTTGPILSFGINIHADTPPIVLRLDYDQLLILSASLHCLKHVLSLISNSTQLMLQHSSTTFQRGTKDSQRRSISAVLKDESSSEDSDSETKNKKSDLISIFESEPQMTPSKMKKFLWFQWVISRATVVISKATVRLMIDVDDIIATVDLQRIYNQYKLKLTSVTVRHQENVGRDEWKAGVLNGRILEVREPTTVKEDMYFLSLTVTQAWVTNIPDSWKDVLHPRILSKKNTGGAIWEIYATVAPLEVMLQPSTIEMLMIVAQEMAPKSECPFRVEQETQTTTTKQNVDLPLCYLAAGGVRLILTGDDTTEGAVENLPKLQQQIQDDTFIFQVGKISVNPYPDNPIIRRAVSTHMESTWSTTNIGAQYELVIKNIGMRSTVFREILVQESLDAKLLKAGTAGVNPALQWTQPHFQPMYTTVLHAVNVSCVLAPANYNRDGLLTHGTALEFNILTDCHIEVSMRQLILAKDIADSAKTKFEGPVESSLYLVSMSSDKLERFDCCPYAEPLKQQENSLRHSRFHGDCAFDNVTVEEPTLESTPSLNDLANDRVLLSAMVTDSSVQTSYNRSNITQRSSKSDLKNKGSVGFMQAQDNAQDASQYLEIFVTTGTIELSFYCSDDMTKGYSVLKIPNVLTSPVTEETKKQEESKEGDEIVDERRPEGMDNRRRSLTELDREMPGAFAQGRMMIQHAKRLAGNTPLLNISLHQPNLYYWKRNTHKTLQASLFDAWVGLGAGKDEGYWHKGLLSTARGPLDPHTGVAPALATLKLKDSSTGVTSNSRAALTIDIERPILFEICADRMKRLNNIIRLLKSELMPEADEESLLSSEAETTTHPLLNVRRLLVSNNIESVTLQTSQVSLGGFYGSMGFDAFSVQATTGARPEKIHATALLTALFVAAGKSNIDGKAGPNTRNFVLQPTTFGAEFEATWDSWRKADVGEVIDPTIHVGIEMDYMTLDFRPEDLDVVARIRSTIDEVFEMQQSPTTSVSYKAMDKPGVSQLKRPQNDSFDHYFKDDLRSGAFKLVHGSRASLPAPYQIALVDECVAWRYPQPRAIANICVHPVPMENKEMECVLEVYMPSIGTWEAHTHFKIPLEDVAEYNCNTYNPEAIFATTWRYRMLTNDEADSKTLYQFDVTKYLPKSETGMPVVDVTEPESDPNPHAAACKLVGSVSIDSYFAPLSVPKLNVSVRCAGIDIYLYNDIPHFNSKSVSFTGYYVTKTMCRNHRTLAITLRNTVIHASPETQILLNTNIESDIFDSATGLMVAFVEEFRVQAAVMPLQKNSLGPKLRGMCSRIRIALHVQKIDTLKMLAIDWKNAAEQHLQGKNVLPIDLQDEDDRTIAATIASALRGRIYLWIYNSTAFAIRIGQEGTDENFSLEPGARFAYRWYNPDVAKKLHFAQAYPTNENVTWSADIPFTVGKYRIFLADELGSAINGPQLHANVHEYNAKLYMTLYGRLTLANVLRIPLQYKVRQRGLDGKWITVIMGELAPESVGSSVLCSSEAAMLLKIKFLTTPSSAWSGDIPLQECPKENVPWLVKVPDEGDLPYLSVWCRVSRGRMDGRLLAALWPLYVLKSNLPLDANVTIATELPSSSHEPTPKPLIQGAMGRGLVSHLHTVGTTAARHNLTFQYRLIDSPVTPIAVPLHYGVTDVSVFTKNGPTQHVSNVIDDIHNWLSIAGRRVKSDWPYSLVRQHWPYQIQPAMMQPCSDVTVRYTPVRAGGGCSLEISLCPLVILCNGSSIGLTLRAHDASPLCKLEPGIALSPPSIILTKPFYISVERGKDTFVSTELSVFGSEPGEYEKLPIGCVALKKPANFAILCFNKLASFSLYYEIIDGMNILGISSTYVFVNRLNEDIKVTGLAVPEDMSSKIVLKPKKYKTISPTTNTSNFHGTALSRLFVYGRLIGADPSKLRSYICLALEGSHVNDEEYTPLAIRIGMPPRKPAYLINRMGESVAIVVTQVQQEGRIIITVSYDPCPQFVFHNRSTHTLAIAEAAAVNESRACPELSGATWHCVAPPSRAVHYSTPAHAARYPPASPPPPPPASPYMQLTFAVVYGSLQNIQNWSSPVFVTEGEQLLNLNDFTVKLRVTSHPHSTLLEVREVGTDDISASDIRKRLMQTDRSVSSFQPQRVGADDNLPVPKDGRSSLRENSQNVGSKNESQTPLAIVPQNIAQYNVSEHENSYLHFLDKRSGEWAPRNASASQNDEPQPSTALSSMTPAAQQILEEVVQGAPPLANEINETQPLTVENDNAAPQSVLNVLQHLIMKATPNPEPASDPENITIAPDTIEDNNSAPISTLNAQQNLIMKATPNPEQASDAENITVTPDIVEDNNSAPQSLLNALQNLIMKTTPNPEPVSDAENITVTPNTGSTDTETQTATIEGHSITPGTSCVSEPVSDLSKRGSDEESVRLRSVSKKVSGEASVPMKFVPNRVLNEESVMMKSESKDLEKMLDSVPGHSKLAEEPDSVIPHPRSKDHIPLIIDNPMIDILGEEELETNGMRPTGDFIPADLKTLKNPESRIEYQSDIKLTIDEKNRRDSIKTIDDTNSIMCDFSATEWRDTVFGWRDLERVRFVVSGIVLELASDEATTPLIAAYVDRAHILLANDDQRIRGTLSVSDIQVDNLQHNTGQFDFPVIASTRIVPLEEDKLPPICSFFFETEYFSSRQEQARLLMKTCFDKWSVVNKDFCELVELDTRLGPLSLCIEDAFVTSAAALLKSAAPRGEPDPAPAAAESGTLAAPLRLRSLNIQPLDLTLTLHTAVRMYIALDHSPLRLSAFRVNEMMTSAERLTHALTVHYLSAAILGAGWMVGGLELLGAPGALAARVGGATGGVRGVASAAAAALLRSLSAWASSLARNLDILAGDEEHARRAAAARRQPPETFFAGITAGLSNLVVNVLGAVGGLAHHPLVGVATGETDSGVEALRRSLLGAVTKPLSGTADLLAFAGHGLLAQTGWDPEPQPRSMGRVISSPQRVLSWRRDCSRWRFTADAALIYGADVLLDHKPVRLLLSTHHLVIVDPHSDKIVEMVNFSNCNITPYTGAIIELRILPNRQKSVHTIANTEDDEQVTQAAMARVARYTGAATSGSGNVATECRPLAILPPTGRSLALYALLVTAIHNSQQYYCNTL